MLESINNGTLEYKKLTPEEMQARGILGRLVGTVADFIAPTRNGRHYSEELWEKTFEDPIMKERIENGVCFGELCHPTDREETEMEKVAVCMPEVPKKNSDGKLTAVFDILDTPNGRILKTLCDYGSTLGVSSRGSGDTFPGDDGNEEVDPSSYTCQGFDIVLIPAVESARLKYVNESLNTKKSLKESLQDIIKEASDNDKKVMEETLKNLNLNESYDSKFRSIINFVKNLIPKDIHWSYDDYRVISDDMGGGIRFQIKFDSSDETLLDKIIDGIENHFYGVKCSKGFGGDWDYYISVKVDEKACNESIEENPSTDLDIDEVSDDSEVDNTESILEELQTSLKQNRQLEQKIISLNEKLSVCYAKEEKYNEQLDKYKKRISKLSESSNKESALKKRVEKLNEELANKDSDIQSLNSRIDSLNKGIIKQKSSSKSLNEELNQRDDSIKELNENVNELKSLLEKQKKVSNKEISALNETIANLKKDLQQNKVSYSKKLEHSNKLVEKYKRVTNNVVNKYIDSQASKLGISSNEIKNRLPESYSISDIDKVCENMRDYKLNISKLPFNTMHSSKLNENVKLKAKPSTNELLDMSNDDDVVDDQLLSFLK